MVNTSNKKEREEIEYLKKELQRVQEEGKAKETKMKAQVDRLSKQNEELKVANKELTEELKHVTEQLRNAQTTQKSVAYPNSKLQEPSMSQSRYTFSTNKSQEQLGLPQQPQPPQ